MGEWERSQRKVGEVAEAALDMAEKNGLTLQETMWLPEIMTNIIRNEMQSQKIPYRRARKGETA